MALISAPRPRKSWHVRARLLAASSIVALSAATLAACGGGSDGSGSGSTVDASGITAPILDTLSGDEKTRVAQLIAEAKSEGELDWIGTVVSASKDPLIAEFKKEYNLPDLNVDFENQQSSDITARIQSQVTARKMTTDLVSVDGAPAFFAALKQAGALLQYNSPALSAYQDSKQYLSDDFGYWVSPDALFYLPIYDPKVYTKTIGSWYDLLDPALKQKMSLPGVPTSASAVFTYWGLRKVLPTSYFKDLFSTADPKVGVGNGATAAQMVAQGQLTVAVTASHNVFQVSKQLGVPLAVAFPKEGSVAIGWSSGILAGSPHPAAAKLMEDFLLSKSAQQILVDTEYLTPGRDDVTVPADLAKFAPATLGDAHAIPLDAAVPQDTLDTSRTEFNAIFGTG